MRRLAMTSLAAVLLGSAVTTASAGTTVLQFLGPAVLEGTGSTLCQLDAREGTNIDFAALEQSLPPLGATFPPGAGCEGFTCFEMPMIDPESGIEVGTGVDCLRFENGTLPGPEGFELTAVTFFVLPAGTLAVAGRTTVQPMVGGIGNGGDPPRTHITGSIPDPDGNSVVGGTRAFAGRSGPVRVSGALSLGNDVFFDCLWTLRLDAAPGALRDRGFRRQR